MNPISRLGKVVGLQVLLQEVEKAISARHARRAERAGQQWMEFGDREQPPSRPPRQGLVAEKKQVTRRGPGGKPLTYTATWWRRPEEEKQKKERTGPRPGERKPRLVLPKLFQEPTLSLREAVGEALQILAGTDDDHARYQNEMGFNKFDGQFGHRLAEIPPEELTPKQLEAARRMLLKYKRQLGSRIYSVLAAGPERTEADGEGSGKRAVSGRTGEVRPLAGAGEEVGDARGRGAGPGSAPVHGVSDGQDRAGEEPFVRPTSTAEQPYLADGVKLSRSELTPKPEGNHLPERLARHLKGFASDSVNLVWEAWQSGVRSFLCADGTGAGKTRQQLAAAQMYLDANPDAKILIITQNERIIDQAFATDAGTMGIAFSKVESGAEIKGPGIYVSTVTRMGRGDFDDVTPDLIVFDEAHNLKNFSAKKTKAGTALIKRAKRSLLLTATPADKAEHIGYLCSAFGLNFFHTMNVMGYEFKEIYPGGPEGWKRVVSEDEALSRIGGLFDALTKAGLMVKREVSMDNVHVASAELPWNQEQVARAERRYNDMIHWVEEGEPRERGVRKMTGLQRLRAMNESEKLPATLEAIKQEIAAGRQVVVFANRVNPTEIPSWVKGEERKELLGLGTLQTLSQMLEEAGIEHITMFGKHLSNAGKVQASIDRFQTGKARVAIMTPQAGGTGLSLDDREGNSPRSMVVMTAPFSATEAVQMIGRINRLTTMSRGRVRFIVTPTTIDRWNMDIINAKLALLGATVEGDVANLDLEQLAGLSDDAIEEIVHSGRIPVFEKREIDLRDLGLRREGKEEAQGTGMKFPQYPIRHSGQYAQFAPKSADAPWPDAEIGFGKHRGRWFSQLQRSDPGYLAWLFDQIRFPYRVNVRNIQFVRAGVEKALALALLLKALMARRMQ